jgi:hypothetical protein
LRRDRWKPRRYFVVPYINNDRLCYQIVATFKGASIKVLERDIRSHSRAQRRLDYWETSDD